MSSITDTQFIIGSGDGNNVVFPDHYSTSTPVTDMEIATKDYVDSRNDPIVQKVAGFFNFADYGSAVIGVTSATHIRYVATRVNNYCLLEIESLSQVPATATSSTIPSSSPLPPLYVPSTYVTKPVTLYNHQTAITGELTIDPSGYLYFTCPVGHPTMSTWTYNPNDTSYTAGWLGASVAYVVPISPV